MKRVLISALGTGVKLENDQNGNVNPTAYKNTNINFLIVV